MGLFLFSHFFLVAVLATGISKRYYYFDPRMPLPVHVMFAANIAAPALTLLLPVFFLLGRLKHKKAEYCSAGRQ